jgi:two-component system, OmpR family, sensor histidine kinase KdpD
MDVALVGGFVPALLAAVAGSLLLNYYFTPPIHQLTIAETNNVLALGVFVVVALLVSWWWTSPQGARARRRAPAPSRSC